MRDWSTWSALLGVALVGLAVGGASRVSLGQEARDLKDFSDLGTRYPKSQAEIVPAEQCEALGLDDIGWTKQHGKVHPDVYAALDKTEKVTEPWRDSTGLMGTVYVQVYLKHEQKGRPDSPENKAAIRELQGKVLSQLGAGDFYTRYEFIAAPGILGYASRAGVEKLRASPDLVAIRLDDKPFPRPAAPVTREDLPTPQPGEATGREASGRKTEADVYRALALHGRVLVIVNFNFARQGPIRQSGGQGRAAEDRVLAVLTANDFWVLSRTAVNSVNSPLLMGYVNPEGLKKLEQQPEVLGIGLEGPPIRMPNDMTIRR
jgi:hypothetical protein